MNDSIIQTPQLISDGVGVWRPLIMFVSNTHLKRNRLIIMRLRDTIHTLDILRIRRTRIDKKSLPPIVEMLWTPSPILNKNVPIRHLQSRRRVECLPSVPMIIIKIGWSISLGGPSCSLAPLMLFLACCCGLATG